MLYEGNICYVRDKLIEEIKQGCISQFKDDITTKEFVDNTRLIIDLLDEIIKEIEEDYRGQKIAVYENPMGSLYYEEIKED